MDGGCFCGQVRYRMEGDPIYVNACHCRDCQKLTGSAFAINIMIEADRVRLTEGEPVRDAEGCMRCPRCNVLLWASHPMFGERILFVRAGTLDQSGRIMPDGHFFVRSKHPWVPLPEGVAVFETLPGEGDALLDPAALARVAAAQDR